MQNTKRVDTLIVKKNILVYADPSYQADLSTITCYQQSIGLLIYAMTKTWFDIAFVVSIISQFTHNLAQKYIAAVKCIFWYFKKYSSLRIMYKRSDSLFFYKYIDSDWAINLITHYLTTRYLFTLANRVISDFSKH